MVNYSQANKVKLPEIVHSKWDEMLEPYNSIITKIDQITRPGSRTFEAASGKTVDWTELLSTLMSVLYKLYWAGKSLEYLVEYYGSHTKSLEDSLRSMSEQLPDAFFFNADVFFSFGYGALDIAAEIIHMVVETGINENVVYFTTVLNFLTEPGSIYKDAVLDGLKRESDAGWLYQFRQYRIFVTHHGLVQPSAQFKYTASDHTVEINLHMLPDNPKKKPPTYGKKRELAPYCLEIIVKELEVMTVLFRFIEKMIPSTLLGLHRVNDSMDHQQDTRND